MLLYLDLNCFNRPFDDQSQNRIAQETKAIFVILQRIVEGNDTLAWSAILAFENAQHPLIDRRAEIAQWGHRSVVTISINASLALRAQQLTSMGLDALDAAHLASAEATNCDYFLTCDDKFTRRSRRIGVILPIRNPIEYVKEQVNE